MQNFRLIQWCEVATASIRFTPDRRKITAELMAHLEDHRDALMARGMDEKEATGKALESMGDAKEIAPQLAAIHKPFWGYFLRVSQVLLVILLVLSLKPLWDYATDLNFYDKPNISHDFDIYAEASYGGDTGRTLLHLSQPDVSFSADGSIFTVTDAAVYTNYSDPDGRDIARLYVLIRQTSLLPRSEHEGYLNWYPHAISTWFSARDSLGNTYEGLQNHYTPEGPWMGSTGVQSGIFTYTHECWITDFPADAEWVEIFYERDGRSYSMYIDLTGGGGQ